MHSNSKTVPGPRVLAFLALGIALLGGGILWSIVSAPGLEKDQRTRAEVRADRLVSITPFRLLPSGVLEPVQGVVGPNDTLLFAYNNGGRTFQYLTVFIQDHEGALHWYHPSSPESESVELPQSSRIGRLPSPQARQLPPGPVVLVGVFSHQPISAAHIEAETKRQGDRLLQPNARLSLENTGQHLTRLRVE